MVADLSCEGEAYQRRNGYTSGKAAEEGSVSRGWQQRKRGMGWDEEGPGPSGRKTPPFLFSVPPHARPEPIVVSLRRSALKDVLAHGAVCHFFVSAFTRGAGRAWPPTQSRVLLSGACGVKSQARNRAIEWCRGGFSHASNHARHAIRGHVSRVEGLYAPRSDYLEP